jgi:glycosyltransferase 2 family protein
MTKARRGFLLRLALSAVALILVARLVSARELLRVIGSAHWIPLLGALVATLADRVMMAWKWRMLLQGLGVHRRLKEVIRIYFVGTFYGSFLPTGVGGDVIRVFQVGGTREDLGAATASVIMERAIGLIASALLVVGCLWFLVDREHTDLRRLLVGVALALVLGVGGLAWLLHGRLPARLARIAAVFRRYANQPALLGRFFGLSFVEQFLPVVTCYAIGRALDYPVTFGMFVLIIPITLFFARIPISIDGLGVTEALYVLLFSRAGLDPTQSFALAMIGRVVMLCAVLPGVFLGRPKPPAAELDPAGDPT